MGSDDIFKKRREERKKRKREFKDPKPKSYLIVTEGERTEPLYFKGIADKIKEKFGGNINVCEIPVIEIEGEGCSTNKLIEKTQEIVNKAKIIYENIWVVFDKDDFEDFDDAIRRAKELGYCVGWSNQCFEYWIYLHFHYNDSRLHRDDWFDKVFKENNLDNGKYEKNKKDIFDIVNINNGVYTAISYAKRRMAQYNEKNQKPSEYNPGTTVHILVEELLTYLQD